MPRLDGLGNVVPSIETSAPVTGGDTVVTVKSFELLPDGVVTIILATPTGAPAGTAVVIVVDVIPVMLAATPPIVTVVTPEPVNPDPVIVKTVPTGPERAETVLITGTTGVTGAAVTAKMKLASGDMPFVTVMPAALLAGTLGTATTSRVLLVAKTAAFVPPILTWAPVKLVPLMVMESPGAPLVGDTLLTVGGDAGGVTGVVPHPPVLMLRAPALNVTVTVFAAQLTPLTVVTCAPHTVAMKAVDAIAVVASIRTLE